ncbi:MAG: DUF927 domain-containing protein [Planctomycetes bacterium]|nr:DUF927 domain-containing protein [Planctomycetota bacterium]
MKDRMRHAIQTISGDPPRRTVFTHLGWRSVGRNWLYLHAGGAIGPDGPVDDVSVRLEEPLDRFVLPAPPDGEELADAVWGWMRVLEVAPKRITVPLFAMVCRAVLGDTDFSGHLYGGTGNFKSCLAALFQQAFGPALHHKNLPGSWESSANALEGLLFLAKDVLLVIDDFVPTGSANEQARRHRDADRVIRGQGNRTGRQRMRPDASLRPVRRSRSLVLGTGEELPRGESLTARMLVMPVGPGDVHVDTLTRCQAEAAAGVYARATAGFVPWLAGRYGEIRAELQAEQAELRAQILKVGGHRRSAEIAASLLVGLRWFARFLEAIGLYAPGATRAFLELGRGAVLEAFDHQSATQRDSDPTARFFELLASALASGRAHVASPQGKVPAESPLAWGWRLGGEGRPEREPWKPGGTDDEPYWHPQGERIGWVEGEELFLEPQASHAVAQRIAGDEGFPLSPRSLRRRLKDAGLLRTLPASRETCAVRVTLSGARRSVLHVDAGLLCGVERVPEEMFAHGA